MKIIYYEDGRVKAQLLHSEKNTAIVDSLNLFSSFCYLEKNLPKNFAYVPCKETEFKVNEYLEKYDDELVAAGHHYTRSKLGRLWLGDHYRKEWYSFISVPFLSLEEKHGGLTVTNRGSGEESISLKLQSADGTEYIFRSVDKDPTRSLRHTIDHSLIGKVFRDQTSAQHPYGAMIVSALIGKLNLLHTKPELYLMPDSEQLTIYKEQYGGLLGMLEEYPGQQNNKGERFAGADLILRTNELIKRRYNDASYKIDSKEYLRARLFDILIGDWSRHDDNWKWAVYDKGGQKLCRPIPHNRDWALSKWDGLLPSLADLPFGMPNTETFDHEIKGFRSAVYQARYLDRFILTEMTENDFLAEAKYIKDHLTNDLIHKAANEVPVEIRSYSLQEIYSKLVQRKSDLEKYALKYYQWLNNEIEIIGTNKKDEFVIKKDDNALNVIVSDLNGNEYYSRVFNSEDTDHIRVYGLNGDDEFLFKNLGSDVPSVAAFGGKGIDTYSSHNCATQIDILDREVDKSSINNSGINIREHWNEKLYDYNREALKFNSWFPIFSLDYSSFTGASLTLGNNWRLQKWGKEDYASKHKLRGKMSSFGDFGLEYFGNWHHVIKKVDLTAHLSLANPEYYNSFYGLGNETIIDQTLESKDFYVAKFNQYRFKIGLERTFFRKSYIGINTGAASFRNGIIANTILELEQDRLIGANTTLHALTGGIACELNFLDHSNFPSKGLRFKFEIDNYYQLNKRNGFYGNIQNSLEYYMSNHAYNKMTLGIKIFRSRAHGEIPFYLLSSIGGNEGLRGYSSYRFTGDKAFYINTELRMRLKDSPEFTIPYELGVVAFYDTGRVVEDGESISFRGLKSSYGVGAYLVPLSRSFAISMSLAWSREQSFYPVISLGSFLN